jgi:DNA-binding LacI/PurR family transcriptional regulator
MSSASVHLADLHQQLERRGAAPLYTQVAGLVRDMIRDGRLKPGEVIQPQRELSSLWNVSEVTVRRALQALAGEGLIEARAGSGTVVASSSRGGATHGPAVPAEARRLRIGIVSADLTDGYPFLSRMMEQLSSTDSNTPVFQFFTMPVSQTDAFAKSLPLRDLDGVLLMSPVNLNLVATCQQMKLPYVLLYNHIVDGFSHCIVVDYTTGILEAVDHLVKQGRRNIAVVTALENRFSTGQMTDAYHAAMTLHRLDVPADWLIHAGYQEPQGYEATKKLISRGRKPDAILYASDYQARGGLIALQEAGLSAPRDVCIIGAGRLLRDKEWPVTLTSIDLQFERVGQVALDTLRKLIDAEPVPFRQVVTSHLVPGETA